MKLPLKMIAVTLAMSVLPMVSSAQTIELQGVTPAVDEDITPPDNQKAAEENFYTFWFKGQIGTQYQANFTVSEEPAFTFVSGGNMTLEDNIHYNSDNSTFTVTYTAEPLEQIDAEVSLELEENQTLTIIAISFPVADGEQGPGAATIGSWIATNFQEWTLVTPSENNNAMGATVEGDAGDSGQFKMFMPQVALNTMTEYDGEEAGNYSVDDFAVYEDNAVIGENIDSVEGGALLNFTTTLPEETSEEQTIQGGPGVSQKITVSPIEPITLDVDKTKVKKYGYVTLSGKIKSGEKGKTVTLWRRFEDTKLKKFVEVITKKNGRFELRIKILQAVLFKAKYQGDVSESVQVSIKK